MTALSPPMSRITCVGCAAPDGGVALYHLGALRRTLRHDTEDAGFVALGDALGKLGKRSVAADDRRSLAEFLLDENLALVNETDVGRSAARPTLD